MSKPDNTQELALRTLIDAKVLMYTSDDALDKTTAAIYAWHTRKLNGAVREEWKLISEVAHSANITAELYIGKAREERLAELEERTDDPA